MQRRPRRGPQPSSHPCPPGPAHGSLEQSQRMLGGVADLLQLLQLLRVGPGLRAGLGLGLRALLLLLLRVLEDALDAGAEVGYDGFLCLDGLDKSLLLAVHQIHIIMQVVQHVLIPVELGVAGCVRVHLLPQELVDILGHTQGGGVDRGGDFVQGLALVAPEFCLLGGEVFDRLAMHSDLHQLKNIGCPDSSNRCNGKQRHVYQIVVIE
mmetsp:Transcript_42349/g.101910  ORF Transcript_42349/g.101910 Transcript_42349/m.101910 type:complete len:209 (-) Transcript_42349:22-648(-)